MTSIVLSRLVDALAKVQSELRALKAEEQALREAILSARPNGPVSGAAHVLTLRPVSTRQIDPERLPPHVRDDPGIWARHDEMVFDITRTPPRPRAPLATVRSRREMRGVV